MCRDLPRLEALSVHAAAVVLAFLVGPREPHRACHCRVTVDQVGHFTPHRSIASMNNSSGTTCVPHSPCVALAPTRNAHHITSRRGRCQATHRYSRLIVLAPFACPCNAGIRRSASQCRSAFLLRPPPTIRRTLDRGRLCEEARSQSPRTALCTSSPDSVEESQGRRNDRWIRTYSLFPLPLPRHIQRWLRLRSNCRFIRETRLAGLV